MKTCPGRGGGIQHILYQNLTGVVARTAVEMNLLYNECNSDNDVCVIIWGERERERERKKEKKKFII